MSCCGNDTFLWTSSKKFKNYIGNIFLNFLKIMVIVSSDLNLICAKRIGFKGILKNSDARHRHLLYLDFMRITQLMLIQILFCFSIKIMTDV